MGRGLTSGSPIASATPGEGSLIVPLVTPAGGTSGYRPLDELAQRVVAVIALHP